MGKRVVMMKFTLFLTTIIFLIDQISKVLIIKSFRVRASLPIIKDFFYLTYTHNTGAAFSILTGRRLFLIITTFIVIMFIIYYLMKNKITSKLELVSFSLIIGGSLGNLFDRIIRGYVVDFLDFRIFSYNFPIFNLADTFIVIGVLLLIINMARKENQKC